MNFEKLLNNGKYQVFLFTCPPSLPLSFACHPWFVINKKGLLSRYEVIASPAKYGMQSTRHLYINALPPTRGLRILRSTLYSWYIWPVTLIGVYEGAEGSVAARMVECIENSPQNYPFSNRYAYTGPNSNTYVQWILNQFPNSGLKLPWNAFGKGYLKS
jgi:hypothetical protein